MPVIEGSISRSGAVGAEGANAGALRWARARYDFAEDGGTVGAKNLLGITGASLIPAGAVVLGGFVDVLTAPTSGGSATIGIGIESGSDVIAVAAISGAPWSTTGRKALIQTFSNPASSVKTTAARNIVANIGTAALTAGKFDVYVAYIASVAE